MTTLQATPRFLQLSDFDSFLDEFCNWKDRPGRDSIDKYTMFSELDEGLQQTIRVSLEYATDDYRDIKELIDDNNTGYTCVELGLFDHSVFSPNVRLYEKDDNLDDYELEIIYDWIRDLRNTYEVITQLMDIFSISSVVIEDLHNIDYVLKWGIEQCINEEFKTFSDDMAKFRKNVYPFVKSQMLTEPWDLYDNFKETIINTLTEGIKFSHNIK